MKRMLCLLAILCLLAPAALAQGAVETQTLTGEVFYPQGSDAQTATYIFRYRYPQFDAQTPADQALNVYFASLAEDTSTTAIPAMLENIDVQPEPGMPAFYTQLDFQITANTEDYVSVLLTSQQYAGNADAESWTSTVFARSGVYAGQQISLSQVMGLEPGDDAGSSKISLASKLAYRLIWDIIQQQKAMLARDYYAELTQDDLQRLFDPENDFYLDEDDQIVFFLQSGTVASEVEGIITFPFMRAELLSAVKQ